MPLCGRPPGYDSMTNTSFSFESALFNCAGSAPSLRVKCNSLSEPQNYHHSVNKTFQFFTTHSRRARSALAITAVSLFRSRSTNCACAVVDAAAAVAVLYDYNKQKQTVYRYSSAPSVLYAFVAADRRPSGQVCYTSKRSLRANCTRL